MPVGDLPSPAEFDRQAFAELVGKMLMRERKSRKWTRRELIELLGGTPLLSIPTVATYEHADRVISLVRFVELCLTMGIRPSELLRDVEVMAFGPAASTLSFNIKALAHCSNDKLVPLREWARSRQASAGVDSHVVSMDIRAVQSMADTCGIAVPELLAEVARLNRLEAAGR
jgi:transcriptional regulator with XRE-family HTH domain